MNNNPQNLLQHLLSVLISRRKFLLYVMLTATLIGAIICAFRPKQYIAETKFVLKNHLFADRTYLYSKDMRYINYYASEDDIERLVALEDADAVMNDLIGRLHLAAYYKTNLRKDPGYRKLRKKISGRVKIYHTPEKHAVLAFWDKNPQMAARIANEYLRLIEFHLRNNYNSVRNDAFGALKEKIHEEENQLNLLTDSLSALREQYGIYDIISPTRSNTVITNHYNGNGRKDFAKGLELIQNLESVKDRAVADLSDHLSLANQYEGGENVKDLSLIQIIKTAQPPLHASTLGYISTLLVCLFSGLAFGVIYVLVNERR
ncbi:hypothetical protein [Rurimicrobium arvi]|uniref:Polysaccharide chain length determinant N-terminal domain-containing protein n=1 Tax=Rurimicrobium arvi TaxID=2049916 RepID=A0ABP8MHT2_9BACT